MNCANCGRVIFVNAADGKYFHEATAEAECWGFPFYGTVTARSAAGLPSPPPEGAEALSELPLLD